METSTMVYIAIGLVVVIGSLCCFFYLKDKRSTVAASASGDLQLPDQTNIIHNGYHVRLGHPADFRVAYRFYDQKEGGRKSIPGQGYRSDCWYEFEGPYVTSIFMIWPEFEDPNGELIAETGVPVESSGTARMWVLIPERREFHRERIHVGLKAYFMEGSRKVAECTVIEILGLHSNPTVSSI